ncbi:MAG: hypothetical protein F4160_14570 [Rhodospirillaceae bacterium]|nr:hypothetical protein [Rhodospirillaceae bacterium]MYH38010.1 hypothetical protein [Rhodospirillaceae bacterium]
MNKIEKFLLILASIFAIPGSIISILLFYSTTEPQLYATVRGYPHHHLVDWRKAQLSEMRKIQQFIHLKKNTHLLRRIGGTYIITIENSGEKLARNVVIFIDNSVGMLISKRDKYRFLQENEISLGDLRPTEIVKVISWQYGSVRLRSRFASPKIDITHDDGVAKMDIRYEIDGYLRFLHRNNLQFWIALIFLSALFGIGVYLLISGAILIIMKMKKSNGSENKIESDNEDA